MTVFQGLATENTENARKARSAISASRVAGAHSSFRAPSAFSVAQNTWVPAFAGMSGVW